MDPIYTAMENFQRGHENNLAFGFVKSFWEAEQVASSITVPPEPGFTVMAVRQSGLHSRYSPLKSLSQMKIIIENITFL